MAATLRRVIPAIIALIVVIPDCTADVTISFSGLADSQRISTYSSQGWDVSDPPQSNNSGFATIAAGDPFFTGVDAIYPPFGTAWFVQIHTGLSFIPDGDSVTIAGLGVGGGGTTSFEVVGFSGTYKVLDETISATIGFPGTTTIHVSDPSLTPVTSLEFAPATPLDYQITSLDVGTIEQATLLVAEPSSGLTALVISALAGVAVLLKRHRRSTPGRFFGASARRQSDADGELRSSNRS
jgi:hypothetical protein